MTIELISITKPHSQSTRIIVIAIDESKTADHILDWSCKHLLRAETDQVFIVNARPFLREVIPIITHAPSVQIVDDQPSCADRVPREKSHFIIEKAAKVLIENLPNIKVNGVALRGEAKIEIVRIVEELGGNVLVIGTRGMTALKRSLFGSVSEYCIHNSKCTVVVTKLKDGQ